MNEPIGVFDSGVGGLSIWKAIYQQLPNESIVYFADGAHCPYGSRPKDEIVAFCYQICQFLVSQPCKLIVVACNTATAMAIQELRSMFDLPIVGIEPAIKPAALQSKTGVIGILATAGTLKGRLFQDTKARFANQVEVITMVGDGLVELVENNEVGTTRSKRLLTQYIRPMMAAGVDNLVLGCTHYPFLINDILEITEGKIHLIDPAAAVAQQVAHQLKVHHIDQQSAIPAQYQFYNSGSIEVMDSMIRNFGLHTYRIASTQIK